MVLYIEYMSVSVFISAIAHGDGSECEDAVDVRVWPLRLARLLARSTFVALRSLLDPQCAERIGTGLTAYGVGVAYFAM